MNLIIFEKVWIEEERPSLSEQPRIPRGLSMEYGSRSLLLFSVSMKTRNTQVVDTHSSIRRRNLKLPITIA